MRIAMVGHKHMPSRVGGVEVVVTELSTRMAALGHDVTVYNRSEGDSKSESEFKGVRIKEVPTLNVKGLAAFSSSYFATREAVADQPDVIHFHAEGPCAMIPLAKRAGIRTAATIHGLDWQRAKWGKLASSYIHYGERVAARHADSLIVLSDNAREYFLSEYGREATVIPNGINQKEAVSPRLLSQRYGLSNESYLLFLGRIVPEKGLHYLIDAYKGLPTGKRLVIAGGPSDSRSYFEAMRKMAQGDQRIFFTGFVEGRELEELYSNAYAYVLPSDVEGMPMSLLEAMSYARCCITSDIPECASILGSTGVTFGRGDVADLRAALAAILEEPAAAHVLGAAAQRRAFELYQWDAIVEQTLKQYEG